MTAEPAQPIVPPYLIELCRQLDPNSLARALESNHSERGLIDLAIDTQVKLADWENDDDFWDRLSRFLDSRNNIVSSDDPRFSPESLGVLLDDEVEIAILSNALAGDERLTTAVLLESPTSVRLRTGIAMPVIKNAVVQINRNLTIALNTPPTTRRRWRLAKALRRVFKGAAGGILIAADVVVPDPTFLVRVASVAGGVDMVLDAAGSTG
jgi:hypothetical protein